MSQTGRLAGWLAGWLSCILNTNRLAGLAEPNFDHKQMAGWVALWSKARNGRANSQRDVVREDKDLVVKLLLLVL